MPVTRLPIIHNINRNVSHKRCRFCLLSKCAGVTSPHFVPSSCLSGPSSLLHSLSLFSAHFLPCCQSIVFLSISPTKILWGRTFGINVRSLGFLNGLLEIRRERMREIGRRSSRTKNPGCALGLSEPSPILRTHTSLILHQPFQETCKVNNRAITV